MKRGVQTLCNVLSGIAGVCFFAAPLTHFSGFVVTIVSGIAGVAFAIAAHQLKDPQKPRPIKFGEKSDSN
jgi:hypothetical protein